MLQILVEVLDMAVTQETTRDRQGIQGQSYIGYPSLINEKYSYSRNIVHIIIAPSPHIP